MNRKLVTCVCEWNATQKRNQYTGYGVTFASVKALLQRLFGNALPSFSKILLFSYSGTFLLIFYTSMLHHLLADFLIEMAGKGKKKNAEINLKSANGGQKGKNVEFKQPAHQDTKQVFYVPFQFYPLLIIEQYQ